MASTLASHSAEQIRDVFHLNLVVPAQLCAAAIPPMAQRGSGHLVNVSSLSMCANTPGFATYGASKAGLSALGESIREEIDGTGIGLTAVEVGFVETDMLGDLNATRSTRAIVDRYHRIGIQRMLDVDEVAAAVRSGVERGSPHVRLPRRSAAGPMMVNAPRRIARGLRRGLPPA